jgi:hypothetical protein
MSSAERYRRNACECVAVTSFFADPRQRATILALAEAWTRLADQAERSEQVCALDPDPENPEKWVPASRAPDSSK